MRIATTTSDLGSPSIENLKRLHAAGYRYLDLGIWNGMVMRDDYKEFAHKIKEDAASLGMKFIQAHAPDAGNPLHPEDLDVCVTTATRTIEFCAEIGIPHMVQHTGAEKFMSKEETFKRSKVFYERLFPAMEKTGVCVLTENSTYAGTGANRYSFNSGKDIREFADYVNHPLFHVCWDIGHANCEGNQYDEIMTIGHHLYALHVHDNKGNDHHSMLYTGSINMDDIMNGLIDSGYKGDFTYETLNTIHNSGFWHAPRKVFEKDKRLLNPPSFMYDQLERLEYEIAEYILKSYNVFEE